MSELSVNHLLGIKYLDQQDIQLIFETADHFKEVINRPIKKYLHYGILLLRICSLRIQHEQNYPSSWPKSAFRPMLLIFRRHNPQ